MGTSNAERQAAFRARREKELADLRAEVKRLRSQEPHSEKPIQCRFGFGGPGCHAAQLQSVHDRHTADLKREYEEKLAKLQKRYEKEGTGAGGVRAPVWPRMENPHRYTKEEWRKRLLSLFHPDRYHGTADEPLANEVAAWLNSMKSKKKK